MINMKIAPVNPWTWQDAFNFAQAVEVSGGTRMLLCAGQTSVDTEGNPIHVGDMAGQLGQAMNNLEAVLAKAGLSLGNVVRLNYYTTDIDALFAEIAVLSERLASVEQVPASTVLGVQRLFHPDILVEIEATAVA